MVEPLLGDGEVVFFLDQPGGRIVEGPHPLFGLKWGMKNGESKNRPAGEQKQSLHKNMVTRDKMRAFVTPAWRRYVRPQDFVWLLFFSALAIFGPERGPWC